MRSLRFIACLVLIGVASGQTVGRADPLSFKDVGAQQVLSVKVGSFREFPAAFDKLAQYCEEDEHVDAVMPQMTLGSSTDNLYAAIAFEGAPRASNDVKVLDLPAATVAVATHLGPYHSLPWSVRQLVNAVRAAGYTPDANLLIRLLHRNSPDTTPSDQLITEIQLPVVKN